MEKVLLCSEKFVKELTNVDDNTSGKLIKPALQEAQDSGLREILGDKLVNKLCDLVANNEINAEDNAAYKELLDKAQYYMAYQAISNIVLLTAAKIGNAGVETMSDERMQPTSMKDNFMLRDFYQNKADFYQARLQSFVFDNRSSYPELTKNKCYELQANLYSAASCNIFLGGVRGKKDGKYKSRKCYKS